MARECSLLAVSRRPGCIHVRDIFHARLALDTFQQEYELKDRL
jgi:hypothetical protein